MRGTRSSRRGLALPALVTSLVVAALCALPGAASAAGPSYVAMGDSYTAGPGILPYAPGAPPECGQSERNYPHLVASALNLSLTDVSCGGAKTEDFYVAQYEDQPPQFDALSSSTQVVTIGMGGNDGNLFGTLLIGCTETDLGGAPGKAPCKEKYEGFVTKTFEEDKGPEEAALREVHVLAPQAKVFVVGYPEITPAHGICPTQIPWKEGDLRWFRKVTKRGDAMIEAGAKANGAIFVNTFKPSEGHNACQPVGTRWIEPLIGSLTGVPVHPNATGEENDAFDVERAMLDHGVR